jgi:hypothetical protein
MTEEKWTLEKFLNHYGISMKDIEKTMLNGVYRKGKWLLEFRKESNEIFVWKNPDSCKLEE